MWGWAGGLARPFPWLVALLSSPRPRPAPTWLNQARLCLADPNIWIPARPLPCPAQPGPPARPAVRTGDGTARAPWGRAVSPTLTPGRLPSAGHSQDSSPHTSSAESPALTLRNSSQTKHLWATTL